MFVLVDAVILKPLPGANARGMVYLEMESDARRMSASPTPELLRLIRDHATSFSHVEAYTSEDLSLSVDGEPLRARGAANCTRSDSVIVRPPCFFISL